MPALSEAETEKLCQCFCSKVLEETCLYVVVKQVAFRSQFEEPCVVLQKMILKRTLISQRIHRMRWFM